jgi:hypothetical protein
MARAAGQCLAPLLARFWKSTFCPGRRHNGAGRDCARDPAGPGELAFDSVQHQGAREPQISVRIRGAAAVSCAESYNIVSPFGAPHFVATLDVANTGQGVTGWTVTISSTSAISLLSSSSGAWSLQGDTLTNSSTLPTGSTLASEPVVTLDGVICSV